MAPNQQRDGSDHRVALLACPHYSQVEGVLAHGINLLGGIDALCPGERYLLKPNLLLGDSPERGSTTHPDFFNAAASLFTSRGYRLRYGDSPGFGSPQNAVHASGLSDIASSLGLELADFTMGKDIPNPDGHLIKQFNLAQGLLGLDGVINLPKFKTHGLTRLTGAVKNLFGCLPGVQKAAFHARLQDEKRFGQMLVDLAELVKPRLHIMDAVWGMEGNGPRNGTLRNVGLVLISTNPHVLDHCAALLMNLDPMLVPTLEAAQERRLYHPDKVEVLGESLEAHVMTDYLVNRSRSSTTGAHGFYLDLFKQWVTPRPYILAEKCTRCGRCVRVCPAKPKALGFQNGRTTPPQYDYGDCIRCYCCQEMCPEEAIDIHTPFLGQFLNKIKI
jgi:uncharacterized protein (DUF362 family)/NAD-dependent dihydropyrimidine dehydrogenase PreA subunit